MLNRIGCLVVFVGLGCSRGEWKPVGDGKTVVNTRTGEIKNTATGLSPEETMKLAADEREAEKKAKVEALKVDAARQVLAVYAEADSNKRLLKEEAAVAKLAADVEAEKQKHNSETIAKIQGIVLSEEAAKFGEAKNAAGHQTFWHTAWFQHTQPYRLNEFPSRPATRAFIRDLDEWMSSQTPSMTDTYGKGVEWGKLVGLLQSLEY